MPGEKMPDGKPSDKEQLQAKMFHFQVLQGTYQTVRQQLEAAVARANELVQTRTTLEMLGDTKPAPALLPIGSDNFVPGKIEKTDDVVVGIGSGAAVKKPRAEAIKILDGKLDELQKHIGELNQQLAAFEAELARLQPQIEAMLQGH